MLLVFAIAISEAKPIIDDLMSGGYVSGRSLIGVIITESKNGLTVYSVTEGSGAEKAGIKQGDLIVKADGKVVTNGGRVLGITALGKDLKEARKKAYEATDWVDFDNKYMRHDIGKAIDEA